MGFNLSLLYIKAAFQRNVRGGFFKKLPFRSKYSTTPASHHPTVVIFPRSVPLCLGAGYYCLNRPSARTLAPCQGAPRWPDWKCFLLRFIL